MGVADPVQPRPSKDSGRATLYVRHESPMPNTKHYMYPVIGLHETSGDRTARVSPKGFLSWAERDLKSHDKRARGNALSNIKKAPGASYVSTDVEAQSMGIWGLGGRVAGAESSKPQGKGGPLLDRRVRLRRPYRAIAAESDQWKSALAGPVRTKRHWTISNRPPLSPAPAALG